MQFKAIQRIAKIVANDPDVRRSLRIVTKCAAELAGAKFAAFVARDDTKSLALDARAGEPLPMFEDIISARSLLHDAFDGAATIRSDDIRCDPRFRENITPRQPPHCPIASFLAVPVTSRSGDVVGGFFFGHDEVGVFTAKTAQTLSTVADIVGLAIESSRAQQAAGRYAAIVGSSGDAIVSKDLNGVVTSWNAAAQRLFGYKAEEMIGKSISLIIPSDRLEEEPAILRRIRGGERVDHYDTVRRRKDGSLIEISLCISPIKDTHGRIIGASKIARDITERRRFEGQQEQFIAEIDHRVKNTLATVQAIAALTLNSAAPQQLEAFLGRLQALARAHDLLRKEWNSARVSDVVRVALDPFPTDRIAIEGPVVVVDGTRSQLLTLALYELARNAAQHGALTNVSGRVQIDWSAVHGRLRLIWQEWGGPRVKQPTYAGFGSLVLGQSFESVEGHTEIGYRSEGVTCTLEMAL